MSKMFYFEKDNLEGQFNSTRWLPHSGLSLADLEKRCAEIENSNSSKAIIKAKTFEMIANNARIAVYPDDIFQSHVMGGDIMPSQRRRWETAVREEYLSEEYAEIKKVWKECGAYYGHSDFGHTSPNSQLLLSVGLSGLLERVERASEREGLTEKQKDFYESCKIVLGGVMTAAKRLSAAIAPDNEANATALTNIACGAPKNIYEAMQLLLLYFFMHEYVGGTRVRTLGRLDVLLYPFYVNDIANGTYTKEEIKEMLKFFLYKFWVAKVPYDLPFCLGGIDSHGNEVTNEMSYLIVESYNELNIYSPKIHIRVSDKTPKDFVKLVLSCIRGGNSSFVFVNDKIGIECLRRVGIEERDAMNYVPIGCYEPAVWGVEICCTGNGDVGLGKAVELVFCNGRDNATGILCGVETGKIESFEGFLDAVKKQIAYMTDRAASYVVKLERLYDRINPDPLLSCQYEHSVETGVDVYEGGAKYNNSSLYFSSIASLVDSVCAVKRLVFEEKRYTFDELGEILRANWRGYERERAVALRIPEKYGNNNPTADKYTAELSSFCAELLNNRPNGRGGVFKAALFTIDRCFYIGARTMATPDGRLAGEPLSKNLSATVGMDKNGVTSLINSVTRIDHASFPTGSVLDVMLHPTAVTGEDGLEAFYGILMTYMKKGGFAMHGNVFDANTLKRAQEQPERYKNLQVRVCGWNVYFVNLSRAEQDAFIKQAEALV